MADADEAITLDDGTAPVKRGGLKRALITSFKVIIAVVGLWYVVHKINWNDTAVVAKGAEIRSLKTADDVAVELLGQDEVQRGRIRAAKPYRVEFPAGVDMLVPQLDGSTRRVTITDANRGPDGYNFPRIMDLDAARFKRTNGEVVQQGLRSTLIAASARWYLLLAAWSLLVVPFLVSAYRWRALMRPQGIELPYKKCLELTFVGQFYSIFLLGLTGGDLVKIIYTARLTGSKTKSIVTILLDRAVGLIALMVVAIVAAGLQLLANHRAAGGVARLGDTSLRNVLLLIAGILLGLGVLALVYFSHRLRSLTGLQRLINHPRTPEFLKHADEVLHRYRGHSGLMVWAFLISLFSQLMLPISAWLSGMAFGMEANIGYYLAYVPLAVLASSVPISPPQGIGVMDSILLHFFADRGTARAGQVFALTQAVRFLPILWNLVGAYWVITGKFARHEPVQEGIEVAGE